MVGLLFSHSASRSASFSWSCSADAETIWWLRSPWVSQSDKFAQAVSSGTAAMEYAGSCRAAEAQGVAFGFSNIGYAPSEIFA